MKIRNTVKSSVVQRFIVAIAVTPVALLSLSAWGASDSTSVSKVNPNSFPAGSTMARLSRTGTIKIGVKFDQPLQGLKELNGKMSGFDIEIAKQIAASLGIPASKITWIEAPSKSRELYLKQGRVDLVIASYTITPERQKQVTMAGPVYSTGEGLMARKGSRVKSIDALKDPSVKVCAVAGSNIPDLIKPHLSDPTHQLVTFDLPSKCAMALKQGQVDAMAGDNAILAGIVYRNHGELQMAEGSFAPNPYGIGVKKGDIAFCQYIDDVLRKSYKDGAYAKAWKATLGKVEPKVPALPTPIPCE